MNVKIECKDKAEADAIRRAMDDPTLRAIILVVGCLLALPTDRARKRAIDYAWDQIREDNALAASQPI